MYAYQINIMKYLILFNQLKLFKIGRSDVPVYDIYLNRFRFELPNIHLSLKK